MVRWLPVMALAVGCTGTSPPEFRGEDMEEYFPFSEVLDCRWEFLSEDTTLPYKLVGMIENDEFVGENRQFTMEYTKDCIGDDPTCVEGDFVRSMTWSLQGFQGVHLHRVETTSGELVLEPSLRFVDKYMKRGDSVTAESNGNTYTSTLEGFGECPVTLDWEPNCAKVIVESSGGPDQVTGTYWLVNDFSVVGMNWDDDGEVDLPTWRMSTHITLDE